ncbi:MAG: hypothetical protein AB2L21_04365 [Anaerolineaceae bacterium]
MANFQFGLSCCGMYRLLVAEEHNEIGRINGVAKHANGHFAVRGGETNKVLSFINEDILTGEL